MLISNPTRMHEQPGQCMYCLPIPMEQRHTVTIHLKSLCYVRLGSPIFTCIKRILVKVSSTFFQLVLIGYPKNAKVMKWPKSAPKQVSLSGLVVQNLLTFHNNAQSIKCLSYWLIYQFIDFILK